MRANILNGKQKYKIMNATSNIIKFGIIINQKEIHKKIFADKKDKQRYLDYAYKIGIKDCFKKLIAERRIKKDEVENIYVSSAEHAAMVKIDEEGVTGAAYTALMMESAGIIQNQVDPIIDRPFVFAVAAPDGSILFIGVIQNIE